MAKAKKQKDLDPKGRGKAVKGGNGRNLINVGGPVPVRVKNLGGITGAPAQEVRHIRRGGI